MVNVNYQRVIAAQEAYEAAANTFGKAALLEALANAFKAAATHAPDYPIEAITWAQYTPSFNDGETCTLIVEYPAFIVAGSLEKYRAEEDEDADYFSMEGTEYMNWWKIARSYVEEPRAELVAAIEALEEVQQDHDLMELLFGDGARIVATYVDGMVKLEVGDYCDY